MSQRSRLRGPGSNQHRDKPPSPPAAATVALPVPPTGDPFGDGPSNAADAARETFACLYRGTSAQPVPDVGDEVDFHTNSFTTDPELADHYADAGYAAMPAVWEVHGASGIPAAAEEHQGEVVAAGRVRVLSVEPAEFPHPEEDAVVHGHRIVAEWVADLPLGDHHSRRPAPGR